MRSRPLLTYFLFASDWFTRTFGQLDASNPVFFAAVYAPSFLAILLTGLFEGRAGLRVLFARLGPRRGHPV